LARPGYSGRVAEILMDASPLKLHPEAPDQRSLPEQRHFDMQREMASKALYTCEGLQHHVFISSAI